VTSCVCGHPMAPARNMGSLPIADFGAFAPTKLFWRIGFRLSKL
jgi:hypothetical protein